MCIISRIVAMITLLAGLTLAGSNVRPSQDTSIAQINAVLDEFNQAASNADLEGYFGCLDPSGVYLGTDGSERWTIDELRTFFKPYFDQERGRAHISRERHVDLGPSGDFAYFDELIDLETLGECRGTGVMTKRDDAWRITQYSLSFTIPNEIVFDVMDIIRDFNDQGGAPQAGEDDAIRAALKAYLSVADFPDSKTIDPKLFASDIVAFWSNGETHHGRASVMLELREAQREFAAEFETFAARAESVHIQRRGDVAWVTCRIKLEGTLTEDRGDYESTVRSSFVFEKLDDQWQMVHEHSDRTPPETSPSS